MNTHEEFIKMYDDNVLTTRHAVGCLTDHVLNLQQRVKEARTETELAAQEEYMPRLNHAIIQESDLIAQLDFATDELDDAIQAMNEAACLARIIRAFLARRRVASKTSLPN